MLSAEQIIAQFRLVVRDITPANILARVRGEYAGLIARSHTRLSQTPHIGIHRWTSDARVRA